MMTALHKTMPSAHRLWVRLVLVAVILGAALLVQLWRAGATPSANMARPAPVEDSSEAWITTLQARLARDPDNPDTLAQLGLALLQRVRETADPTLYLQAENALESALAQEPAHPDGLVGMGVLQLARHDFDSALAWGEQAHNANPYGPEGLGVMVDALVELGRYDEAISTLQRMVDLRPGVASYSRVSYLRELHGDVEGAIDAMAQAVAAAPVGTEGWLWSQVQLGNLYLNSGKLDEAKKIYEYALYLDPRYPYAQAGMARVQRTEGDMEGAIQIYNELARRMPLPEFVIALGELHEMRGNPTLAGQQYEVVRAMQALNEEAGMNVDLEMALFNVDHGEDGAAALAQARQAYEARPTVHAADVLSWALFRQGQLDEAARYSEEAQRLGTRDAVLYHHAAEIAAARGDSDAADRFRREMLDINPYFIPPMSRVENSE